MNEVVPSVIEIPQAVNDRFPAAVNSSSNRNRSGRSRLSLQPGAATVIVSVPQGRAEDGNNAGLPSQVQLLEHVGVTGNGAPPSVNELADQTESLRDQVLTLALLLAFAALIRNILLVWHGQGTTISELLFAVLVPYFGFEGAKKRSRSMLNCFWTCNVGGIMIYFMQLLLDIQLLVSSTGDEITVRSPRGGNGSETKISRTAVIIRIVAGAILCIIQGAACQTGRELTYDPLLELEIDARRAYQLRAYNLQGQDARNYDAAVVATLLSNRQALRQHPMLYRYLMQRRPSRPAGVAPEVLSKMPVQKFGRLRSSSHDDDGVQSGDTDGSKEEGKEGGDIEAGACAECGELKWDQGTCTICLDDFEASDEIRLLPCKHVYHKACIDEWLNKHSTCPLCHVAIGKS